MLLRCLLCSCLFFIYAVYAEPPAPEALDTPPTITEPEAPVAPEVTVIRRTEETLEEYRVNGRLAMIKVTPAIGYPYYLIDTDGDGSLETSRFALDTGTVSQWLLFRW